MKTVCYRNLEVSLTTAEKGGEFIEIEQNEMLSRIALERSKICSAYCRITKLYKRKLSS